MLKRCGSIAHHENQVDRRSYEPVAAPRQRIEKETLMHRRRLVIGLLISAAFPFFNNVDERAHVNPDRR
jgi:hypothetical protein